MITGMCACVCVCVSLCVRVHACVCAHAFTCVYVCLFPGAHVLLIFSQSNHCELPGAI